MNTEEPRYAMNRRRFLRSVTLLVPAVAAPRIAYSFLWAPNRVSRCYIGDNRIETLDEDAHRSLNEIILSQAQLPIVIDPTRWNDARNWSVSPYTVQAERDQPGSAQA